MGLHFLNGQRPVDGGDAPLPHIQLADRFAGGTAGDRACHRCCLAHLSLLHFARQLLSQLVRPRLDDRVMRHADDGAGSPRKLDLDLGRVFQQSLEFFPQRRLPIVHDRTSKKRNPLGTTAHSPQFNLETPNSPIDVFRPPQQTTKADVHPDLPAVGGPAR